MRPGLCRSIRSDRGSASYQRAERATATLNQLRRFRAKLAPVRVRIERFQAVSCGSAAHPTPSWRPAESRPTMRKTAQQSQKTALVSKSQLLPQRIFKTGAFNRSATLPRAETGRLVDSRLAQSSSLGSLARTIIQRSGAAADSLIRPWSASARSRFWMRGSGSLKKVARSAALAVGPPLAGRGAVAAGSGSARRFPHRPCGPEL